MRPLPQRQYPDTSGPNASSHPTDLSGSWIPCGSQPSVGTKRRHPAKNGTAGHLGSTGTAPAFALSDPGSGRRLSPSCSARLALAHASLHLKGRWSQSDSPASSPPPQSQYPACPSPTSLSHGTSSPRAHPPTGVQSLVLRKPTQAPSAPSILVRAYCGRSGCGFLPAALPLSGGSVCVYTYWYLRSGTSASGRTTPMVGCSTRSVIRLV
mmetsp:Transcript_5779/g.20140  ORF Transcript_5779/g.20140 Transcript_5779/m.20140 type:complete len:210 (-) Transcript_5779:702-1331(-)